ncbi:MAG: hypothetical protein PHE21_00595 [Candidatus Dojkabacteria bacterium]|nr:hypothetical protein [Candidatus Dojkabacteria bacterium]
MKKVLIVLLVLGAGALLYYFLAGKIDFLGPGFNIDEDIDLQQTTDALKEEGKRTVYASCNDIPNSSNCIDYIGSMWKDDNSAQLNCGEGRNFSLNACPYSEFGGCQMNGNSVMEFIAWVYEEGPGEYTFESIPDAMAACNSMPNAKWVTVESLLEEE